MRKIESSAKKPPLPVSRITISKIAKEAEQAALPPVPPAKSILKITPNADETKEEESSAPAARKSTSSKKSLSSARKSSSNPDRDRRRSKAFSLSGADSGPLLEPEVIKSLEEEAKQLQEQEAVQEANSKPETKKKIFKSKQAQKIAERAEKIELANKALYETSNTPSNQTSKEASSMKAISSYLELDDENDDDYDPKESKKKTKSKKSESKAKTSKSSKTNKENPSPSSTKETKTLKSNKKVLGETQNKPNEDISQVSDEPVLQKAKSKRSIETIYENQELDTSSIVNSTVSENTMSATNESETTHTPVRLEMNATYLVKKQKLNSSSDTSANDSMHRPDSPPMPVCSSEFSSRRNKKPVSYREIPLNVKMRCDKSDRLWVRAGAKK